MSDKTKKFINEFKQKTKYTYHEYQLKRKILQLFRLIIDICVTGLIVYYVLTHFNFLSVGLAIVTLQYYVVRFGNFLTDRGIKLIRVFQKRD